MPPRPDPPTPPPAIDTATAGNELFAKALAAMPSPSGAPTGMSRQELAEAVNAELARRDTGGFLTDKDIGRFVRGETRWPRDHYRAALRTLLGVASDRELGFYRNRNRSAKGVEVNRSVGDPGRPQPGDHEILADTAHGDDELEALELSRRVAASDLGEETITRLEQAVDELAVAYATSHPDELLRRVRRHLGYLGQLIDVRATLRQRRRLLTAGGWLSLLAATAHVDLRQSAAMRARLRTTAELAGQAGHTELRAWCLETGAWDALTRGDFRQAVDLSRQAQTVAPAGSSAHIQATAQEGRAWARTRQPAETHEVLDRMSRLTSSLAVPDQPEHHYVYDPDKALSYTATTLAWAGDPSAELYARALIEQLENPGDGPPRPRRIATARLDLALSLLASGEADEAAAVAATAIASGRVVPSTWWRAHEIVAKIEQLGIKEAAQLRDAYEIYRPH